MHDENFYENLNIFQLLVSQKVQTKLTFVIPFVDTFVDTCSRKINKIM
jgi:hypothetical protein